MSVREKKIAWLVGIAGIGFLLFLVVRTVLIKPLRDADKKIAAAKARLDTIRSEKRAYDASAAHLKKLAPLCFADKIDQASARSGEILTQIIIGSGLQETDFTRLPSGPKKMRGANEIGWSVQGEGKMPQVINLIFQLQNSPYLHRIEGLSLSPAEIPGRLKVRFRFLTLVLDSAPALEYKPLAPLFSLDSPERKIYDMIIARDILRPYVKAPPQEPGRGPSPQPSGPPSKPGLDNYRIVSLSEWQGQPEVHVRDMASQKVTRYKAGDELAGHIIVAVDYRPMPTHRNGMLQSFSRVILKTGSDFWAVEGGQTLAEKFPVTHDNLPPGITKS
jgi:hypothetical protein